MLLTIVIFYRICQFKSSLTLCRTSTRIWLLTSVSYSRFLYPLLTVCHSSNIFEVHGFLSRFPWVSSPSDDGAHREVNDDPSAQMGVLPWQCGWRAEGPGSPKEDTVCIIASTTLSCTFLNAMLRWINTNVAHIRLLKRNQVKNDCPCNFKGLGQAGHF